MDMMAVNPIARVIAPRFWGAAISLPLLVAMFSTMGVYGGFLIGAVHLGVDPGAFWGQMKSARGDFQRDILNGVVKSVVLPVFRDCPDCRF